MFKKRRKNCSLVKIKKLCQLICKQDNATAFCRPDVAYLALL